MPRRYPFLRLVIVLLRTGGFSAFLLTIIFVIASFQNRTMIIQNEWLLLHDSLSCVIVIGGVLAGVGLLASTEWIKLHIDMEEHARAMRGLLRRQSQTDHPPEWARDPNGIWSER